MLAEIIAPKCSIPICLDDCSTTDQMAQSPSSSPTILPDFESGRNRLPLSISAAAIQASIPCFTQMGTATVRPLPTSLSIPHQIPFVQLPIAQLNELDAEFIAPHL